MKVRLNVKLSMIRIPFTMKYEMGLYIMSRRTTKPTKWCSPSEDSDHYWASTKSDQNLHCALIRNVSSCSQGRLWSNWVDVQADLSLCWVTGHFVGFVVHYSTGLCFDNWAASWQNQWNGMCAQRRLRSAWASTQFDQSLHCALNR